MSVHILDTIVFGPFPDLFPLKHARIGWRNIMRNGDVSVSSTATSFSALALENNFTNEAWRSDGVDGTITVDAGSATNVDYVGIAAHNLGDTQHAIEVQYSFDDSTWVTVDDFTVPDNSPIMALFSRISARYWRVRFVGGNEPPQVAILYIGEALAMQRPIYGGHGPVTLNRSISKQSSITESGQFIGNIVKRRGQTTTYDWSNLSADWYRENFDPFAEYSLSAPFFIAWRPADHPDEVAFAMATDQPRPQNQGVRDLMSVSMQVRGLVTL